MGRFCYPTIRHLQNATSRGFRQCPQDTSDELNGRFTDMQGKMNILVNGMELLRSINMDTRNVTFDIERYYDSIEW